MKMRESEIFNNYIRLATDAGLISEDSLKKTADPNEKTRYDRYSFSDLEALYGHKFKPNKEDDESIVDVAHPDTIVVGPAYDAMNAVVENGHQRQDIMTYIALKTPDGHLVQRRYVSAKDALIKNLVSVGFEMDSIDEEPLMSLADSCAGKIHKEAALPALAWGAISLLGALGYLSYGSTSVQKVSANAQLILERLGELSGKPYANSIRTQVEALKELADMFEQSKGAIIANSLDDVVDQAGSSKAKAMIDLIEKYKAQQNEVMQMIPRWLAAIDHSVNSQTEVSSDAVAKMKSFFGGVLPDSWQAYFQQGGSADERELIDELEALGAAIEESQKVIAGVNSMASGYQQKIKQKVEDKESKENASKPEPSYDPLKQTQTQKPKQQAPDPSINPDLEEYIQNIPGVS